MSAAAGRRLRLGIVFMKYPYPSETFAGRDVRAYRSLGHNVDAYDLKTVGSPKQFGADLFGALRGSPGLPALLQLARSMFQEPGWDNRQRMKCLALLPAAAVTAHRLHKSQPDVLHLFWGHYPALVAELCHHTMPATQQSMFLGAYDLWLKLPISKRVASRIGHVFTHANDNVDELAQFLGDEVDVTVIHRGIDLEQYPVKEVQNAVRKPRVFAAGRLVDVKGFDDVIEAFAEVVKARPDAELMIAGDGPDRERLETMVSELGLTNEVTFLGWIDEEEVPPLLMTSRVSVLLSRKPGERLPNVLKEAMAAGCVVVTTPTPGAHELVIDGETGFMVDHRDCTAAAQAMLAGLDEQTSEVIAAQAIRAVRDGFDARKAAERYVERWGDRALTAPKALR